MATQHAASRSCAQSRRLLAAAAALVLLPPRIRAGCSAEGENCNATGCCADEELTCYKKNDGWAACLSECEPGVHKTDPKGFRTAWDCVEVSKLCAAAFKQCGGKAANGKDPYNGPGCCDGCTCKKQSEYYSQCMPPHSSYAGCTLEESAKVQQARVRADDVADDSGQSSIEILAGIPQSGRSSRTSRGERPTRAFLGATIVACAIVGVAVLIVRRPRSVLAAQDSLNNLRLDDERETDREFETTTANTRQAACAE